MSAWLNEIYVIWGWPAALAGPVIALWLGVVVLWARTYRVRPAVGTLLIAALQFPSGIWLWHGVFGVPESPLKFYVTVLFTVIPSWLLYRATQRDNRRNQDRRDAAADRIAESPDARFALYLRSFGTTETLAAQPYVFDRNDNGDPPVHLDLEQVLRVALGRALPLVAAGRPDDLRGGAGRLVLPAHRWQPIVADLARRAELVLVMPSANPGTLWEMRWLRQHRQFAGTVFVMPEQQHDDGVQRTMKTTLGSPLAWRFDSQDFYRDHAADWAAAVVAAQGVGIALPPYQFEGAMFTLNPDGTVRTLVGLNVVNHFRKITRVRRVLAEVVEPGADRPDVPVPEGEVVFRPKRVRHALITLLVLVLGTAMWGFAAYESATASFWLWKVLVVPFGLATVFWPLAAARDIRIGGDFAVGPAGIRILPDLLLPWSGIDRVVLRSTPDGWYLTVVPAPDGARPAHLWNNEIGALVVAGLRRLHVDRERVLAALREHAGDRLRDDDTAPPAPGPVEDAPVDPAELVWQPGRLIVREAAADRIAGFLSPVIIGLVLLTGWFLVVTHVHSWWHVLALPLLLLGLYGTLSLGPQTLYGGKLQFDESGITHWTGRDAPPVHHQWETIKRVTVEPERIAAVLLGGKELTLSAWTSPEARATISGYAAERYRETESR